MDLARYKLDILGVQETRLQEQEIDLGDHKLYLSDSWLSGVKSRQGGVGVAVKKSLINSIVEQVALSERFCYVKFAAQRRANLAVVVCYAPTNEASLQEKDLFWSQLSDLASSFKHRERICVIGDLNAEPGHQLNDTMSCRGPFGMGEENENSEKLLSFCTSHKLLVGGTWFQHRQVHRYTFNPPDPSCRKKMLDHILFAERYRGCLTNVRSRRGKTTITDHELVIAEVSMKLLSKKSCFTPRISSAKLQDETTRDLFTQEVKLHLDKSGDFENTEQSWDNFRKALNQAAVKCLLPDKRVNKPWISPDSLELIRKRADLQLKKHSSAEALLEFTNCCKEVRKALRADKRAWLERKGQEVQSFADRGNLKEVFGASQQICRNWRPQLTKLVSSTGVNLRTKEERLERWTEHFSQLLNPSTFSCSTRLDPEEAAESLPIDLSPIRFEEVLEAVRRLKNGKASGPDNISCEMLKAHKGIVEWLWDIIDKCWSTEVLPDDWKVAEIVPLYKSKGKRSECSNHRGISLLSVPGKVFASVTLNRCKDSVDRVLREEQCGFRKSRGCADQLFALRQIIEKSMAFQLDISFCFIDFRAAFDSVDREQMYQIMKHYGLPQKVINIIRNSYDGFKCRVKAEGEKGRLFDVRTGVRQGDVWSPILFGLVINYILANSVHGGLDIGRLVADLDFADDVALVGVSDSEVQENLHRIEALAEAAGLKINVAKTKNMGVKCDSPNVVAVPSIQQNVEILTGTHKGKLGLLAETSSQSRLTIGTEVLLGTKKKAGWFETQDGRKLRLKSLAEAKPALVASQQQSAVADLESLENESGSAVADQESLRCQNCQRQFSTVTGRKVHQTRFCKAGLSKNVVDKSKFEQLEASLTCDKCERKFKTVNGRKVHQSRYCGKPKAAATRVFSCKVQDVIGNEFENIEAFKYLGSYVSLKHGDLQEVNCKLAEGRQRFANFQNLWKSKQLSVHLKCNLYKALVLSAVLYSSETWTLSKLMERKLESFHCGCLRRILRVSYLEKATNDEIMSRSRMPQLSTMIMLKRIKWYGHIQRMEPGRLARSAFDWDPPDQYAHARRAPGGQRKTWMSQIEGDCVRNKVSFTRLQEKAATGSKNAFNNFVVQHFTE